ncbi:hypothetical protein [Bordetella sp. N]|uniref:hypothetical protein n=1 Tax=Bordetella sp. N TaxID=1746199 RepID=UPI00070D1E2D|nr:hypothetical protein [Bordetella sp. N]ALM82840.1 hypothetical protein ASB57_07635 [Bordetella sp. N]
MKNKKLIIGSAIAVAAVAIGARYFLFGENFSKNKADSIIEAALADPQYAPSGSCVNLLGAELPGNITIELLEDQQKLVDALVKAGLITVDLNAGSGKMKIKSPDWSPNGPDKPLGHVELTPLGRQFYDYQEYERRSSGNGETLVMTNRFCARLTYGGVQKFTPPAKNPFDENPNEVSWVNFTWKFDDAATPWLAVPDLRRRMFGYSPDGDGWVREGMMLEKGDNGYWALGNKPYIIRW